MQAIVLCEDTNQLKFAAGYLLARGLVRHRSRIMSAGLPTGGSGEQYVRERFPVELERARSRRGKAATVLVVVTDADSLTVRQRRQSLIRAATKAGQAPLAPAEPVLVIVPKWCIENWFHYVQTGAVEEQRSCKPDFAAMPPQPGKLGRALADTCAALEDLAALPPSLQEACAELGRWPADAD